MTRRFTTTFETKIDHLDDEFEVPVILDLTVIDNEYWEITKIARVDNGDEIIPTTDIQQDLDENIGENFDEIRGDYEASYADYRYEQYREERFMEL
jgi:hypothetical protein